MRPNILYIHSHDTGRYVEPYGYAIPTPNISRLAAEGMNFRRAFCAAPTCSPSRAALLTGQSAHSSGMLGLSHRGWGLYDYSHHLVHTLRAAGYRSTLIGTQHVARDPAIIGYDEVVSGREVDRVAAAREFFAKKPAGPFFLDVGFGETHRAYPEPACAEDVCTARPPAPLPDTPETRRDMACYMASARRLDAQIGAVLDALDESGLAGETLVICTTDHGLAFPRMKCNLTDHGIGVLLMLRGPGGFVGGRVSHALVSQIDLFPTLCDLLGIAPPDWLEGRSIMPHVRGQASDANDEIFAEVTYHAAYEPIRAVRTDRWKYIRRYGDRRRPVLPNCDDSTSKEAMLAAGWADTYLPPEELYDVALDPNEAHDRAGDPACAAVLADMRDRLDRWMRRTDDPLLAGYVAPPSGARVNPADGRSPGEPAVVIP